MSSMLGTWMPPRETPRKVKLVIPMARKIISSRTPLSTGGDITLDFMFGSIWKSRLFIPPYSYMSPPARPLKSFFLPPNITIPPVRLPDKHRDDSETLRAPFIHSISRFGAPGSSTSGIPVLHSIEGVAVPTPTSEGLIARPSIDLQVVSTRLEEHILLSPETMVPYFQVFYPAPCTPLSVASVDENMPPLYHPLNEIKSDIPHPHLRAERQTFSNIHVEHGQSQFPALNEPEYDTSGSSFDTSLGSPKISFDHPAFPDNALQIFLMDGIWGSPPEGVFTSAVERKPPKLMNAAIKYATVSFDELLQEKETATLDLDHSSAEDEKSSFLRYS